MGAKRPKSLVCIYFACLSVFLNVCLYPINVKTAELIGPKFCVGPHMTPGKVYESKFQRFDFHSIFNLVLFYNFHKEKMFTIEIEDGREAP